MKGGKHYSGREMICPCFRREEEAAISCEGWEPSFVCKLCFVDSSAKRRHKRRYCASWQYEDCPHYWCVDWEKEKRGE